MHLRSSFVPLKWWKELSFRRDLGVQLLALYLLFVGPVLVGALVFSGIAQQRLVADVKASDLALAHAIALESDAPLQNATQTVLNLAEQPDVIAAYNPGMRQVFSNITLGRADINLVYRLAENGAMLYHYPEGPRSTVGMDFSFRGYFKDALKSDGPLFSSGRISPTTGKPVATVVMPMRDERGEFAGIVATNLALERLSDTLAGVAASQSDGLIVTIVDQLGQVIAYPGLLDADLPQDSLLSANRGEDEGLPENLLPDWDTWQDGVVSEVLAGQTGSIVSTAPDGSEWLRSYVPIPVAGWGVIVQRPSAIAFATIQRFHRLLLAAIGIYMIGGLIFWLALSRHVIIPLEKLADFSRKVGERTQPDDWRQVAMQPLSQRQDQVGHLARSLTTMAENIDQRFVELSTLLETSRAVVSTLESKEVIDSILDEVQRLLQIKCCAIVTLDERLGVFRMRASRGLSDEYVRTLRIEPSEPGSPAMRALQSQTPVQITDIEAEDSYSELRLRARAEGFRSILAIPLLTQHAPPAVLVLYNPDPHRYSDTELELIASFANHAAMAMENATLHGLTDAQLQEQTRRLEAIVESMDDGLILEGLGGRVLFCNQRAADMLGVRRSVARQRTSEELTQTLLQTVGDSKKALQVMRSAINGSGPTSIDVTRKGLDGRPQDLRIHLFEVTDARGELIGRGQYWQDITHDKELDRMKSALLSTVSHELRTPLAAIKGYATTLLAQDVQWDEASQREFIQTISDETDRLAEIVTNLLDLSRLEAGALHMNRQPHLIADVIRQIADREQRRMTSNLNIELEHDLPSMWIDRPRVETVLRNLLENADKYSPPDSAVDLTAVQHNGDVIIAVRDWGPGVPEAIRTKIFDRYYRADRSASNGIGGAGLGLAICKGFVEAHGGRIWVTDGSPGAVFAFSLPVHVTLVDDSGIPEFVVQPQSK